ncbi:MAG: hypothetical protein NC331_05315 [Lachnospiraceae bacterium]|nr:hypothetical protein [Lachnospiraceae bacterium]MCM1238786.1 hypothetical protein [Lachnospiraceae bacterium]
MGKIDILDKRFFEDRTRFAELVNTEIYRGERILVPHELESLRRSYPSLGTVSGEKTRDVLMRDRKHDICYGLEIETESDYSMPQRVMVYDASEYEHQIREIHKIHKEKGEYVDYRSRKSRMQQDDFLIPVLTMVLYLGEGQWKGKRGLLELLRISPELRKQLGSRFQDYEFPLIEADCVDPKNYDTDLREFFQAMQCRGNLSRLEELFHKEGREKLNHETELVISAHLGDRRLFQQVEEGVLMCKALEDLSKREREIGRQEGTKQGAKQEKERVLRKMLQAGLEESLIMNILNCTKEEVTAAR